MRPASTVLFSNVSSMALIVVPLPARAGRAPGVTDAQAVDFDGEDGAPQLDVNGKPFLGPQRSARQVIDCLAGTGRAWGEDLHRSTHTMVTPNNR